MYAAKSYYCKMFTYDFKIIAIVLQIILTYVCTVPVYMPYTYVLPVSVNELTKIFVVKKCVVGKIQDNLSHKIISIRMIIYKCLLCRYHNM